MLSILLPLRRTAFVFSLGLLGYHSGQAQQLPLTADARVESLLQQMSTEEKLAQLYNNGFMTTPTNERLKVPGFVMDDGPHGVRFERASSFPTGMAVAATWNRALAYRLGQAMGEEFWAYGKHQQLGPCLDIVQDPRAGRNAEAGGEDPFLIGQLGGYIIRGIQTTPVMATAKHFMIEGKQSTRHSRNQIFTDRGVMEQFGYNFRMAVQEGGALSVMSSYNLINGEHAAESPYLMNTVLRQRWGFPFYVVSDWDAVHDSQKAIVAGNDVCMGSDDYQKDLPGLVASGKVPMTVIDAAVRNVLRSKIMAGMLDFYPTSTPAKSANTPAHQEVALQGARESVVLLKNTGNVLPFNKSTTKHIAVIGPNADQSNLNCFGSSETTPAYAVSLKQALDTKLGATKVYYAKGCDINSIDTTGFRAATELARQADVVVFAGGLDLTQEGEGYNGGSDRVNNSTVLPGMQQRLIRALARVNPNVVVVLQSGGVCSLHESLPAAKGLVYSFYAGQEAGTALADVLFGDYNPAGRMPVTMPTADNQLPEWNDDFTDDFGNGYRWYDEKALTPEFAFGAGLSYTTFQYSNLRTSASSLVAGAPVQVMLDVQNTGKLAGDEVTQLYLTTHNSPVWMPKKELKGFERLTLAPGEKKTVTFQLTAEDFYRWNEQQKAYQVNAGRYTVRVGGASDRLPLTQDVTLKSGAARPDLKVTEVFSLPRFPRAGEAVRFYALVRNLGNAPVTGQKLNLSFSVNNAAVASAPGTSLTLQPGQATLVPATQSTWQAPSAGKTTVRATIDADKKLKEWLEDNNSYSRSLEVY
ncbi:glycoside hydrolase family 3 C-terminal domain-containing protein [Hymenobacter sp. J193]|uniref:glycoside hydrolase family 3 C-terminal domain-containing protein n=1 Tax=Hymenobacter sp. J193 TaxID=2898429 RepID=UPI0021513D7D|nr:glycoside hydrolase family 3 C-terminal domain-containing protein [Hymenobacter sp. J193]MCR5889135.1 glycoside hydrolase family 3 C-terminal domain-containing protein [Hymenobacter sp. J193]